MPPYLTKEYDWNRPDLVSQYDEISVWAAPCAKLILDQVPLGGVNRYLDIGCGTGFPLLDLAQRLGSGCRAVGIDPWEAAARRCKEKILTLGLLNVEVLVQGFEEVSIERDSMDLITSCLGVNNFARPEEFFERAFEWLKPSGTLAIATNLTGTFTEFYELFAKTCKEGGFGVREDEFTAHVQHRGTIESYKAMIHKAGFASLRVVEAEFKLRYASGTAFLNHSVIASGFMGAWKSLVPQLEREALFAALEERLNESSRLRGEFSVTVPIAYLECRK